MLSHPLPRHFKVKGCLPLGFSGFLLHGVRVCTAVIKTMTKATWGKKSFSLHSSSLKKVKAVTQGRNPKTGAETEATEECCLLACPPWLAQFSFYTTRDQLLKGGSAHNGLGLLTSIINPENVLLAHRTV